MNSSDLALLIQTAAVVVAVGAAVAALVISWLDRRNARRIAADDRAAALSREKLLLELALLQRLTENLSRGGSSDPQVSKDMGAEALSIIGVIGPDRLPTNWAKRIGEEGHIRDVMNDPATPEWLSRSIEAQLAVEEVVGEIRTLMAKDVKA